MVEKNNAKTPILEGDIEVMHTGLKTVLDSFESLAKFKVEHEAKVKLLSYIPIDEAQVSSLQAKLL